MWRRAEQICVRVVFLEWHSVVHKIVDAKIDQSTMSTVPKVRLATNQWLMDCMYCKHELFSRSKQKFDVNHIRLY